MSHTFEDPSSFPWAEENKSSNRHHNTGSLFTLAGALNGCTAEGNVCWEE